MNLDKHFGDAFDIVKRSLLGWLGELGAWSAHPMFTHDVSEDAAHEFGRFLGVPIISREPLRTDTDRRAYLDVCNGFGHVFLDPDTGLKQEVGRRKSPRYLFADELVRLAEARPRYLTLVFDQSLQRGNEEGQVTSKLDHLSDWGVAGLGYVAQAAFILVSKDSPLVERAHKSLALLSALPPRRFVLITPSTKRCTRPR